VVFAWGGLVGVVVLVCVGSWWRWCGGLGLMGAVERIWVGLVDVSTWRGGGSGCEAIAGGIVASQQ